MATNNTDILMVAAIDFGTTYSGFAYSYKGEYDNNKLDVYANHMWNSGGKQFMSQKTPTCILLNKDKEFESFGFDAENQYADIIIDGEADDYYFFDRFKMMLHTREDISKDMEISDVRGRSLPAIDVFSAAIGALRQHLMNQVEKRGIHLRSDEIKWVLTVPAMWTDKAKEFMRESAEQAEIRKDRLLIALEPEAASIYCQHLPPDKLTGAPEGFSISDNDAKYLVVDIGGGTVDITAHHKVGEDDLQELCSASGGACGGTTVDKEYLNLYETIVGERVMETLQKDHTVSYLDLLREFETVKRNITETKRLMINFTIPLTDLNVLCERFLEKDFKTAIKDSEYHDKISIVGDKMRMNKELMQSLFETTKVNIIREIRNVLDRLPNTNLKTFLLVGGFSECQIIQDAIKLAFPDTQILIPQVDAGLAVVKGAVLFGHKPDFITSRITQYTYGRRIRPIFDESKHDPQKRVEGENADRCRDVFDTFMKKNESVPVDTIVNQDNTTITMARKSIACVVAIDFGTTYSGYAFSTVEKYKKNKLDISLNPAWNSGAHELVSCKTPTTLLLTKGGEFMSYGYTAERQYENILLDKNKEENDYLYFRRFKMELYSRKVSLDMKLKDVRDTEYPALDVFSLSTKALKENCLNTLREQGYAYHEEDIKWLVTVPAIWSAEAKMFVRKACEKAGIPRHRLVIALEPEVASLYCITEGNKNIFRPRTKLLVVDLGGGTADITAHEILKNGFFKQILHSTGNDCGGISVDREFFNILEDIIGTENMKKFRNENTIEYLEICSSFESVKRNITREQTEMINIAIPIACLDELDPSGNFDKMLQNSEYADKISVRKLKMRLDPELAISLFSKTIEKLVSVITGILQRETARSISVILLVGGFAASKLVQHDIKKAFPNKRIIIPKDPTVAVLKGAVLFGHRPDVVTTRVTTCSYGRKIKPIFNPRIHENRRMVKIDGEPRCDGVFELLIKSGTSVPIGTKLSKSYHTVSTYQEHIRVALYRSSNDNTKYVDEEDCCLVGECIVPVLRPSDHPRNVTVQFEFGDTEIYITAVDKETRTTVKETFRLE